MLQHLAAGLATDDGIKIPYHFRIRMGPGDSANDIKRIVNIGHPITHRLIEGILESC